MKESNPSQRQAGASWKKRGALGRGALWLLLGTLPSLGWGQEPADASASRFEAVRTLEPPRIDGRLDEAAWVAAPAFSGFHQSRPHPGEPPSERTEVRVLYDEAHLYVGVRCFDHEPQAINAQLGRRDRLPASDLVWVMIDSLNDRRTGTAFAVNAGGTLADALILQDTVMDTSWDGVWEGAAARDAQGWSAELRIPLELLRFPKAEEQQWGFHVRRRIARTNEQLDSVPLPPEVNALVSRFARLHSLQQVEQPRYLTLLPYVALQLRKEPRRDGPRLLMPLADVGLDAQASLTSTLALTFTLSPDYSQVEADQLIVNLTRLEIFFPEKRPFFLEGLDLFAPEGTEGLDEQTLFYSRRIGLDLPLLAAVKLSGTVHEGVQVGVLDALVAGVADPSLQEALERGEDPRALPPDRGVRFHPWRPLHFAPNFSLPAQVLPPTNFFAATARVQVGGGNTVSATTTLATPLREECQLGVPEPEEDCKAPGGRAAALNTALSSPSGDYELTAQVAGSQVTGGPLEGELLDDGTLLRDGDTGLGVQLSGGKLGGEPWRLSLAYSYAAPRLELNRTGFQPVSNEQVLVLAPAYVLTDWAGFIEASLGVQGLMRWSADGRSLPLGTNLELFGSAILPSSSSGVCGAGVELDRKDLREVPQTGVAFQRPSAAYLDCNLSSDAKQPVSLTGRLVVSHLLEAPAASTRTGPALTLNLTWKPLPRLQTTLGASYTRDVDGPRWLETREDGSQLFGDLTPHFLTLTLRQLVVLTPTLTLQAFSQLLSGYSRFGPFYEAGAPQGEVLRWEDLSPTGLEEDPSSRRTALNVNLVLRWEYALGSTLFVVYTRSQSARPVEGAPVSFTLLPQGLAAGPHSDSFLLKLSYLLW